MKKILVLGGDGFCGWPTALHLASRGHRVVVADSLNRREIDTELGIQSLTPIASADDRFSTASSLVGDVALIKCDLSDYDAALKLIQTERPDTIVHFAEIRSAPYSMKSPTHRAFTVNNNINVTHNILNAIVAVDKSIHLVHLGTMGVYGYTSSPMMIPDGYLPVTLHGTHPETNLPTDVRIERSLYPSNPGSVYHMTKVMDHTMFQFYAKNWGVPITDLHQGIVYGVETDETLAHPTLTNRFDYDSAYGTVLNRFLVQAAMGHPLTVYGTGGQTRAFIHIRDTVKCVRLAVESTVEQTNVVRTMNQVAETHNVLQLANLVSGLFDAKISNIENPRNELAENSLFVSNASFRSLGFEPITLADSLLQEVNTYIKPNLGRVSPSAILPSEFWR